MPSCAFSAGKVASTVNVRPLPRWSDPTKTRQRQGFTEGPRDPCRRSGPAVQTAGAPATLTFQGRVNRPSNDSVALVPCQRLSWAAAAMGDPLNEGLRFLFALKGCGLQDSIAKERDVSPSSASLSRAIARAC